MVVIGIGQSLRGDDAAGLEAVEAWRTANPATAERPDLSVETLEVPGLALLERLQQAQSAIIVDAIRSGAAPGTLLQAGLEQIEVFTSAAKSAHGWGVAETLQLGRRLDPELENLDVHLLGIEGKDYSVGRGLSSEVLEALPRASIAIQKQVDQLLNS